MEDDGYDTVWPPAGGAKHVPRLEVAVDEERAVELRPEDVWIDYAIPGAPPVLGWFPPQRCPS